jgi:hypothetical protein
MGVSILPPTKEQEIPTPRNLIKMQGENDIATAFTLHTYKTPRADLKN